MGRFGEAQEMAKAALFLASDESSYMTGNEFLKEVGIMAVPHPFCHMSEMRGHGRIIIFLCADADSAI